jgi:hypothetical protein
VTNLNAEALLITGVYGTGKTSVVEEIADVLESERVPYAALDLDWLGWADSGIDGSHTSGDWQGHGHSTMLANLFCVVNNYLDAGIRRFVMAYGLRSRVELNAITATLSMPLRVVRLELSLEEIERRLHTSVTSARHDDLREAEEWLSTGAGAGLEELAVRNEGPIRDIALHILKTIRWCGPLTD